MLNKFFKPSSVAVIGASSKKGKIGNIIFENIRKGGFSGKLYAVNKDATPISGHKPYGSISEISGKVDLAVIATPARTVPDILSECADHGVKNAIVISSGFSETGEKGKILEDECKKIINGNGIRVLGPNCLGVYDANTGFDTLFLTPEKMNRPFPGNISIISQSGAVGASIVDRMSEKGMGLSKFVSYGNAMDISESDLMEYLGEDGSTEVILSYMEGVKTDGKDFIKRMRRVSVKKPIIVLKSGKTEEGKEAVSSHTGILAGSSRVYSAAFKQSGIIEVNDWIELLDSAQMFSSGKIPKGDRLLILTNGGGFGVLAADSASQLGMLLHVPSKKMSNSLRKKLPDYVSISNPMDIVGDADVERYQFVIEKALKEYDAIMIIIVTQTVTMDEKIVEKIKDISRITEKPIFCCASGGEYTERLSNELRKNNIPVYPSPERALKAFKSAVSYSNQFG